MNKIFTRATALLLSLCMIALFPLAVLAEETPFIPFDETRIALSVESSDGEADPGEVIPVQARITANSGFRTLALQPVFSEGLSLVEGSVAAGTVASADGFTFSSAGGTAATGVLVSFSVKLADSAPIGEGSVGFRVTALTDASGSVLPVAYAVVTPLAVTVLAHDYIADEVPPTCTEPGHATYTCSRCGATYSIDNLPSPGHNWGAASYVWSSDYTTCTASRTCKRDASHKETETVTASVSTAGGVTTYTAVFTNAAFAAQTKELQGSPEDQPRIVVESKTVTAGEEFTLTVSLENNPGVMQLEIKPEYAEGLTFVKATKSADFPDTTFGKQYLIGANEDVTEDVTLITVTLSTAGDLAPGEYAVNFTLRDSSNADEDPVDFIVVPGVVTVQAPAAPDFIWGDANGDGAISNKDIVRLKNYLANYDDSTGTSTYEIFRGADANGDGVVNNKDIVRLKNYLANYDDQTGLSTVILGPAV